jgi:signal transduction histidine kinase
MADDVWVSESTPLSAVREVTNALLTGRDPDRVLALVATHARRLAHADLATISVATTVDPRTLRIRTAVGRAARRLLGMEYPACESPAGQVMRTRKAMLDDARAVQDAYQPVIEVGGFGPTLIVPLVGRHVVFGALLVANRASGRRFDAHDLDVVEMFASQASLVLDSVRAEERLQELLAVADRERTGRDLHDTVIQRLFAAGMTLESARTNALPGDADAKVSRALEDLDATIRQIRATVFPANA